MQLTCAKLKCATFACLINEMFDNVCPRLRLLHVLVPSCLPASPASPACWRLRSKRFDGMLARNANTNSHSCVCKCVYVRACVCVSCNGPLALLKSTQFYF